jgi:hypothetical protein
MREVQPPRHSRHELVETGITSPAGNKRPPSFEPSLFGTLRGSDFLIPDFPNRPRAQDWRLAILFAGAVQRGHYHHTHCHHKERANERSIYPGRQHIFGMVAHSVLEGPEGS